MIDWGTVGSSAVLAAILGPTTSYFALRYFRNQDAEKLARLREDLNRETKRIDAERASLESRFQMQYTWLYQERAKAMSEVYQALIDATDAFDDFSRSWGSLPGDERGPKDKWLAARDAGARFTDAFRKHRLLFSKAVAESLTTLNRQYVAIFNAYYLQLHLAKGDEYQALLKMMEKGNYSIGNVDETIQTIENAFRRLYGSDEDETSVTSAVAAH